MSLQVTAKGIRRVTGMSCGKSIPDFVRCDVTGKPQSPNAVQRNVRISGLALDDVCERMIMKMQTECK